MSSTTSSVVIIDVLNEVLNEVSNEVSNVIEVSNEVSNEKNDVSKEKNEVSDDVSDVVVNLVCNMCVKANREDFNTHSVRDSTGKVTCPYLLSIICRYCKTSGHTVSYCPVLKLKEANAKAKTNTSTSTSTYKCSDGFISVKVSKHPPTSGYIKKNIDVKADAIKICNMFASIDMDATVNDNLDIISKFVQDKSSGPKNIVLPLKLKPGTSWADECDDCSSDDDE